MRLLVSEVALLLLLFASELLPSRLLLRASADQFPLERRKELALATVQLAANTLNAIQFLQ